MDTKDIDKLILDKNIAYRMHACRLHAHSLKYIDTDFSQYLHWQLLAEVYQGICRIQFKDRRILSKEEILERYNIFIYGGDSSIFQ